MRHQRSARATGFTLVELLTIIAVVAVLASILFAVFSRVRENGRRTVCQSNLKQIALAMQQYVQDSDGRYPARMFVLNRGTPAAKLVHWNDAIMPYVKSGEIFWCPTSQASRTEKSTSYGYNSGELTNLVVSPRGLFFNEFHGKHEAQLPSTIELAFDQSWFEMTTPRRDFDVGLHSNGMNISFADGHAKWYSMQQLDEIGGGTSTF